MDVSKNLKLLDRVLVFVFFFLFPILFLTGFNNSFTVPKVILLSLITALSLLIKAARVVVEKKIVWKTTQFDNSLFLLMLSYLLSIVIVSPNKIAALIDPTRGGLLIVLLAILSVALPKDKILALKASLLSLIVTFVVLLGSYFSVFSFLPESLQFVNTKGFNLWGNLFSMAIYAGFFLTLSLEKLRENDNPAVVNATNLEPAAKAPGFLNLMFIVGLLTLVVSTYTILKDIKPMLFPINESWQVSVDILKNPKNAFFGIGPGNYVSLYTRSKPIGINNSPFWNLNIEESRSSILHIFTETGVLGLTALFIIFITLLKHAKKQQLSLSIWVLILAGLLLPLSQAYFFLIFTSIYLLSQPSKTQKFDLKDLNIFSYGVAVITVALVFAFGWFYYKAIAPDYLIGQSIKAANQNQVQKVYDLQVKAIQLNPYSFEAREAFIQTNLALANSLAQKKKPNEEDKQQYTQLIQQALTNARDAVTLNPQKATNWANLASVYQLLLGQVEEADSWTIASLQRAISLDPNNPNYRFSLGSVYYRLGNYQEASRFFEQAISLKPDIANYYYNLAWSSYQQKDYNRAVNALEATLQYTEKGTDDFKKVKKELAEFKALLPEQEVDNDTNLEPETLSQPEALPTGQPTISLPKDSAPPEISITPAQQE